MDDPLIFVDTPQLRVIESPHPRRVIIVSKGVRVRGQHEQPLTIDDVDAARLLEEVNWGKPLTLAQGDFPQGCYLPLDKAQAKALRHGLLSFIQQTRSDA